MDAGTGETLAHELTNDDTSDPEMVTPLLENAGGRVRRVFADGAYDGQPTYEAISDASPPRSKPKVVTNPRKSSIPDKGEKLGGSQRELQCARIAEVGPLSSLQAATAGQRMAWQKETDYGLRSLVETAVFRIKALTGASSPRTRLALSRRKSPSRLRSQTRPFERRSRFRSAFSEFRK